ncbi:MAG: hypothetical protein J4F47_05025 [Alphaproteobacteria bacterium]|nr:hypothetical protein [Alphaproteobacteria bacterium]
MRPGAVGRMQAWGRRPLALAVLGAVLIAAPRVSHAVETAAHGAHLAWCLGLAEAAPEVSESAAAEALASALQARIDELGLDAFLVEPAVEDGRRAARAYAADHQETRLEDALGGCRTSLATGAR